MEFNSEIVSAFCGIVATFAIVKYQSGETKKQLEEHEHDNKRLTEAAFKRLDEHGEAIVALRTKQESTMRMVNGITRCTHARPRSSSNLALFSVHGISGVPILSKTNTAISNPSALTGLVT